MLRQSRQTETDRDGLKQIETHWDTMRQYEYIGDGNDDDHDVGDDDYDRDVEDVADDILVS